MSIQSLLKRIAEFRTKTSNGTMSYEDLFKGTASAPPGSSFLPGLRPVEYDVNAYFKDVFAGPVF
ncbi:MAG: hypothetical protein HT580_09890 [Dechloromonas sp.]|nr:MAG: hypothetical protein HT580_09890 [Dechloromonas sp.]